MTRLVSLFALCALAVSPALADEAKLGDALTVSGTLTQSGSSLRVGGFTIHTSAELRAQLGQLVSRQVTLRGTFSDCAVTLDGTAYQGVTLRLQVDAIVSPRAPDGWVEGVISLAPGGGAVLEADGTTYRLSRLPSYLLASLRGRTVKLQGWGFGSGDSRELAITAAEATVTADGWLSDESMSPNGATALKAGTDRVIVRDLRVYNTRSKRLRTLSPSEWRKAGDLLFARAEQVGSGAQGWVPTSKLSFGPEAAGLPGGPTSGGGIVGGLTPAGEPLAAAELDALVEQHLRAWYRDMTLEGYEPALSDPNLTEQERKELLELRELDLDFDSVANIARDADLDYWEYEDFEIPRAFVAGYTIDWFGDLAGIGLSKAWAYDARSGEVIAEGDIMD